MPKKNKENNRYNRLEFRNYDKFKLIKSEIVKGSMNYNYEFSKEFFLVEPYDNDMHVQN